MAIDFHYTPMLFRNICAEALGLGLLLVHFFFATMLSQDASKGDRIGLHHAHSLVQGLFLPGWYIARFHDTPHHAMDRGGLQGGEVRDGDMTKDTQGNG